MTNRRNVLTAAPAAGALLTLGAPALTVPTVARAQGTESVGPIWRSQSMREQPVTSPDGIIAAAETFTVNERMGADRKVAAQVAPGVYALRGFGIAQTYALNAPRGWIIIDTADTTQLAAEMRAMLEEAVGGPIRVAAILFTHWHYASAQAPWRDEGTETWGHERLDANLAAEGGLTPFRGVGQSRAIAQFGILHPRTGPDGFPNVLGFGPEKLTGDSSYQPPQKTFSDGQIVQLTVAGEEIEVAPSRSDTTCDQPPLGGPGRMLVH